MALACRPSGVFACFEDQQCVDGERAGRCETNGYCSFDDPSCPSGQRYGEHAGQGLAQTCVDVEEPGTETIAEATSESAVDSLGETTTGGPGLPVTSTEDTGCTMRAWHRDADGDGFGDPEQVETACDPPSGYVEDGTDCDDADPRVNPAHLGCPNPASLVGWWRFDGDDETIFEDDSGLDNHGSPIGAPSGIAMGAYREALLLDGATEAVDVSPVTNDLTPRGPPTAEGTLEAWVRSDGPTEPCQPSVNCAEVIVHVGPSDPDPFMLPVDGFGPHAEAHLHLYFDDDEAVWSWSMYFGDDDANCRPSSAVAGIHLVEGQWTHVAGTWSQDACKLYVDGVLVDEVPIEARPPGVWDAARVGTVIDQNRRWLHGAIDEVMVFTEARSAAEIQADCGAPQCTR